MKTILLTEDDPFISDIYTGTLKREGYRVDIARDPDSALEKINNNHPDLLILDMNLHPDIPGPKDGLSILRALRENPKTKDLKVVTISNYSENDCPELSELPHLGVLRHFLKIETTPEELGSCIKEILR